MRIFSQDLFFAMLENGSQRVTVTINPYLINQVDQSLPDQTATVTLSADGETSVTGTGPQTITVNAGSDVTYSVSKAGYTTIEDQKVTPYSNISKNVTLSNIPTKTVTINPTPADASVKITCVETSNVTNASTAQVEIGYHYNVEVTKVGLTTTTAGFVCSAETEENTHNIVMDATISWGSITPSDATRTIARTYDYQNPVIDTASIKVPCTTQIVYWKAEKPGYTTVSGTVEQASGVNYLVNTTIPNQVMLLAELHFTIRVTSPVDATITATVYNPGTGVTRTISGTGTTTINCYMGEQISYTVSKSGYFSESGSATMGSTDLETDYIALEQAMSHVTIACVPAEGVITLLIDGGTPITGTGQVYATVPVGSTISYSASYAGATSEVRTHEIDSSSPYLDTINIEGTDASVDIITTTTTKNLQPGHYYFILVGAGSSGGTCWAPGSNSGSSWGSQGGYGGGSGYIEYGNFLLTTETSITFTVGAGGVATSTYGDQQSGNATSIARTSDGYVFGQANGGNMKDGGSGGAARGTRILVPASGSGLPTTHSTGGNNGGLGGGTGGPGVAGTYGAGTGYYGAVKSYENNAGIQGNAGEGGSQDVSGGGGRGLVSIQSSITVEFLRNMNADRLQVLYNSLGGGGSGGSPDNVSSSYRGGGGGGGGGWTPGSAGTVGAQNHGGDGGDGAVLIARYGWD